jgi:simple sugar transport system ATP-binding protein
VIANDHIDLTVEPGEIHGLLGENGAGKSTLMNILYGLLQPDGGEMLVDDRPFVCHGPRDAIAVGIGMVHQHFMLVPVFTVAENVMLGAEYAGLEPVGVLNRRRARAAVVEISQRYGLAMDPNAVVEDLPVGVQQRVEIVKALSREVDLLILDEPTAVLTPQETEDLIEVMRALKAAGKSIVFITHKLKEVKAIADVITVIRNGHTVAVATPDTSEDELAALMVGRSVNLEVTKEAAVPGEPVLEVAGLVVDDERGHRAVDGVDLTVHSGEVLGIAGVQGNGQTELVEAIMGLQPVVAGDVRLQGTSVVGMRTSEILRRHVGYVPEDRTGDGLVQEFTVAENLVLNMYNTEPFGSRFVLHPQAIAASAAERVAKFDVRTSSPAAQVATLSGGNQQKCIVAREFTRRLALFVAAQPTRGVDVGSIEFIHSQIIHERDVGTAVLLVSSELDEVLALADRVAVMFRGRILAVVSPDTPREEVGLLMAGVAPEGGTARDSPSRPMPSGRGTSASRPMPSGPGTSASEPA